MAGYEPPPLGPYQYHEVLSALRKAIKLNQPEDAIYWAWVVISNLDGNTGVKTVAKQLWIMAAEDIDDPAIVQRAFAVFQMAGQVAEADHVLYLVYAMCKARKWWETEDGREVDRLWAKAMGDLRTKGLRKEIPSYALDRHTRRGWQIFRETGKFDDRYTGTDLGRQKTVYLYLRDGVLDPKNVIEEYPNGDPDFGFKKHWAWFRGLLKPRKDEIEPNDPLGTEDAPGQGSLFGDGAGA